MNCEPTVSPRWMFRLLGVTVAALVVGCQPGDSTRQQLRDVAKEFEASVEEAKKSIHELTAQREDLKTSATEEVEKLFIFEYRVPEFPLDIPANDLEAELLELGRDRWECFHAERTAQKLRFYCKRRPRTYLRYVPRFL